MKKLLGILVVLFLFSCVALGYVYGGDVLKAEIEVTLCWAAFIILAFWICLIASTAEDFFTKKNKVKTFRDESRVLNGKEEGHV